LTDRKGFPSSDEKLSTKAVNQRKPTSRTRSKSKGSPVDLYQIPAKRSPPGTPERVASRQRQASERQNVDSEIPPSINESSEVERRGEPQTDEVKEDMPPPLPPRPHTVSATPKRQVQLATTKSNMADWFAHGTFKFKGQLETRSDMETIEELSPDSVDVETFSLEGDELAAHSNGSENNWKLADIQTPPSLLKHPVTFDLPFCNRRSLK
jgi:hypothetical protein